MAPGPGPHFITGPVYVRGAAPGDMLQVDILDVQVPPGLGLRLDPAAARHAARTSSPSTRRSTRDIDRAAQRLHDALGHGTPARSLLRHHRHRAAAGLGPLRIAGAARFRRQHGQQGAARPAPRSICRSSTRARCSSPATATACRATARSASPRWRPASPAPSGSPCARTWRSTGRSPRAPPT